MFALAKVRWLKHPDSVPRNKGGGAEGHCGGWRRAQENSPALEQLQVPLPNKRSVLSCPWAKGSAACREASPERPPALLRDLTSLPFPSHVCLYNGGRLKNKQNHVYWDSHPGPKLRTQNCPHHGSLGYMDGPGRGKGESPRGKELAEWFPHKRPLPPKPQRNG